MVGVLPSTELACSIASRMARPRAFARCPRGRARASRSAAAIVPRSVRKSFAVKSPPVRARMSSFTSTRSPRASAAPPTRRRGATRPSARRSRSTNVASAASVTRTSCAMPPLARNRNRTVSGGSSCRVAHQQGGEAAAAEARERLLRADADGAEVERAEGRREHALARQLLEGEVAPHGAPAVGQHLGERGHAQELLGVLLLAPHRVVEVLAPPGGVDADGEDVRVRGIRDPHVLPGGRHGEVGDAGPLSATRGAAVGVHVAEAAPPTHPGEPGRDVGLDPSEARHPAGSVVAQRRDELGLALAAVPGEADLLGALASAARRSSPRSRRSCRPCGRRRCDPCAAAAFEMRAAFSFEAPSSRSSS